jgi:mitochondrial translocator assembly and maintenance protein 41
VSGACVSVPAACYVAEDFLASVYMMSMNDGKVISEDGQMQGAKDLLSIAEDTFCMEEVEYAFGYGSGVFAQDLASADKEKKVLDLILVVKDSHRFHESNMKRNHAHYWIPPFMFDQTAVNWTVWWQRHAFNTSFLSNPRITFQVTNNLKYGVVQKEDLADDLQDWMYLYLAGRMHKPILTFLHNDEINAMQQSNLHAALCCSLLLLSTDQMSTHTRSSDEVYAKIASLSYTGDPRMTARAEDPQKISKLVNGPGQKVRWNELYQDAANHLQKQGILDHASTDWKWDSTPAAQKYLWQQLPKRFQVEQQSAALHKALKATVSRSSRYQSMKGLITAGPIKSWKYAMRKLSKGLLKH